MKKAIKWTLGCLAVCLLMLSAVVIPDKISLSRNLIRLHVVANSDSPEDQQVKQELKNAIIKYLQPHLEDCGTIEDAYSYLQDNLSQIEAFSNEFLGENGYFQRVSVSFEKEAFPIRHYDSFSLPSGVYQSLRIRIGEAEGKNWWCVVFPSLCIPAAGESFESTAAGAGFSDSLSASLTGEEDYELEFFLLDCIGKLENFLVFGSR